MTPSGAHYNRENTFINLRNMHQRQMRIKKNINKLIQIVYKMFKTINGECQINKYRLKCKKLQKGFHSFRMILLLES